MKSAHENLKDATTAAISDLFSDKSVSMEKTRETLQEIRDDIDIRIESLNESIERDS